MCQETQVQVVHEANRGDQPTQAGLAICRQALTILWQDGVCRPPIWPLLDVLSNAHAASLQRLAPLQVGPAFDAYPPERVPEGCPKGFNTSDKLEGAL